jgi:hypothetical protein
VEKTRRGKGVLIFAAKFAVIAPVCLVCWWLLLPYYALVLGWVSGAILKYIANVPVDSVAVSNTGISNPKGLLNTGSTLEYVIGGVSRGGFSVGYLVTNVAAFVALVLATAGLGITRRLRIVALGCAILAASHVGFILLAFLAGQSEFSTGIGQLLVTLPFVLWVTLAYWDQLTAYFASDEDETMKKTSHDASNGPETPR